MSEVGEKLETDKRDYALFEKDVLQDNIILCDAKSGFLLAFAAIVMTRCLDKATELASARAASCICMTHIVLILYAVAIVGFICTVVFVWRVVRPRLRPHDDFVYWGSKIFTGTEMEFAVAVQSVTPSALAVDLLRHLYILAEICRRKFANFQCAAVAAEFSTIVFVLAEVARIAIAGNFLKLF
jgi:hypothetical protein